MRIIVLFISLSIFFIFKKDNRPDVLFDYNSISIELVSAKVVHENGIGDDWSFVSKVEDKEIKKGVINHISLQGKKSVNISSIAIEVDPKQDDVGEEVFVITQENIGQFKQDSKLKIQVEVYEPNGDGAGNTAICEFEYRLIPV